MFANVGLEVNPHNVIDTYKYTILFVRMIVSAYLEKTDIAV
jgi:hypothetical protein